MPQKVRCTNGDYSSIFCFPNLLGFAAMSAGNGPRDHAVDHQGDRNYSGQTATDRRHHQEDDPQGLGFLILITADRETGLFPLRWICSANRCVHFVPTNWGNEKLRNGATHQIAHSPDRAHQNVLAHQLGEALQGLHQTRS